MVPVKFLNILFVVLNCFYEKSYHVLLNLFHILHVKNSGNFLLSEMDDNLYYITYLG